MMINWLGGGIKIEKNTVIAKIKTTNDVEYKLRGVVDGFIIEFNERLLKHPEWLLQCVHF